MITLLNSIISDPLFYIGAIVAAIAVFGFLVYLRGFLAGVGHILLNDGHAEHQAEAQVRTAWGFLILLYMVLIWEIIRALGGWFGYGDGNPMNAIWLVIVLLIISFLSREKKAGGGH